MIVDVIFAAVKAVLTPVLSIFPTWSLLATAGITGGSGSTSPGYAVGSMMSPFSDVLPIAALVNIIASVLAVALPFYAAYKIANWAWRHIPDLGGFGPGAG